MAILITNKFPKYINLTASSVKSIISEFLTWGQSVPARFWGDETPEYWGGVDPQAQEHYDRVIADGGVLPSGLGGVNSFFQVVKEIYGTADITTAISVGLDPQVLGYKLGAGSGTTLGQAAQKLYSCSGASGDVVQTTAASQPLLLVHEGANYWFGSGVSGNFVSTPNAAANNIVNDFDIKITATYIFNSTFNAYIGKWDSGQQSWRLYLDNGNRLVWNIQGQALYPSSVTINSTMNHLRVTRQASNGEVKYFFSAQPLSTSLESITWVQLGVTQIGPTGSAPTTTSSLRIAQEQGNPFNGKIYRLTLSNSIDGAPVVDFNPNQYNAATSQTQWTSSTGEVWTINTGTATTGYKGVLVDRTIIQGDGVDDLMQSGTITSQSICTNYLSVNQLNLNTSKYYLGSSVADGNIIYSIGAGSTRFGNNTPFTEIVFSNVLANRLSLLTAVGNASSSLVFTNNANQVSGTVGSASFSNVRLFAPSSTALLGNAIISTFILAKQADNSTNRTSMYNYIRSINNAAF